jgi:hypothetical protein
MGQACSTHRTHDKSFNILVVKREGKIILERHRMEGHIKINIKE